jgi:hypothetical protein
MIMDKYGNYRVSQNWRTNYLLPYRGCLNVHEKNMEKMFPSKKSIIFIIIITNWPILNITQLLSR